ncbi:MAG: aldo/keto reductase [Planctomycetota bacterium]
MNSRRHFLKSVVASTAGLGAAATSSSSLAQANNAKAEPAAGKVDRRRLGRTEAKVSILGLGLGSAFIRPYDQDREAGHALLQSALDHGINYWDTARGYKTSEEIIGPVVKANRDKIFLVSKSAARDYDGFMREVETSLNNLQTDRLDLLHFHNLKPDKDDLAQMEKGCVRAVRELIDQKVVPHFGVTGHSGARFLMDAIKRFDPDALLSVYPCTRDDEGRYEDELLPLARERDMGVIAMKTVRRARNADLKGTDLVRYALSLDGIATTIVGLDTLDHLNANAQMATKFEPLNLAQRDIMHREVTTAVASIPTPWEQPGYEDGVIA